jgi:hypothetical protein
MSETDLGTATIVYEHPEEGTVEKEVDNEAIAYFQDHWLLKRDEDDSGSDLVRRIPAHRVYYVDRTVDEFSEEVTTLKDQVESLASDIRAKLPGSDQPRETTSEPEGPVQIAVESDEGRSDRSHEESDQN